MNENGYLQVNNDPILWTMLNAIKEQQKEIEQLKEQIRRLQPRAGGGTSHANAADKEERGSSFDWIGQLVQSRSGKVLEFARESVSKTRFRGGLPPAIGWSHSSRRAVARL